MRTLSAVALALIAALSLANPARSAPSHAETGVFVGHVLERASDKEQFGLKEAAHAKDLGVGWTAMYVDWKAMQPTGPDDDVSAKASSVHSQFADRLTTAKAQGLKVNVTFLGTPQWASGNANPYYPPTDPTAFGAFVGKLAAAYGDKIDGYELGNEPDGKVFWLPGPDPVAYAKYAQSAVDALKVADPTAVKFVGGLVGGNAPFMEQVLNAGLKDFDAVAFHSGTACKLDPPSFYNRQNAFIQATSTTAYRELIHLLESRGINAPVADTAAGWSTSPGLCNTPGIDSSKKGGVEESKQAEFLRDYFGCIEADPKLKYVFLFTLYDLAADEKWDHRMGLRHAPPGLAEKPAYGAMKSLFTSSGKPAYAPGGSCGGYVDHKLPTTELKVGGPVVDGAHLHGLGTPLYLWAKGSDEHPIVDVDFFVNDRSGKSLDIVTKDGVATKDQWFGGKELKAGDHTIIAVSRDEAGNESAPVTAKLRVVDPKKLPTIKTTLTAKAKSKRGLKVNVTGALTWVESLSKPDGQIRVWFKKGKFVSKYNGGKARDGKFNRTFKLRKKGKWTVSVFYEGEKPFGASRAKKMTVKVK